MGGCLLQAKEKIAPRACLGAIPQFCHSYQGISAISLSGRPDEITVAMPLTAVYAMLPLKHHEVILLFMHILFTD